MFEVNDKVVYGVIGVCEIVDVNTPPIKGIDGKYYFLQPVYDDKGIIYSPVNSTKVLIRNIMTSDECNELIDRAKECKTDDELNEKVQPFHYDDMIKSQDPYQLLHLIRSLYNIKNERMKELRKMKSVDNRMLNTARKLLFGEIAISMEESYDVIETQLDELLSVM